MKAAQITPGIDETVIIGFIRQNIETVTNSLIPSDIKKLCRLYWGSLKLCIEDEIKYKNNLKNLWIQKANDIIHGKYMQKHDKLLINGYIKQQTKIFIPNDIVNVIQIYWGSMPSIIDQNLTDFTVTLETENEIKSNEINKKITKVEEELKEAQPALEAAQKAVSNIRCIAAVRSLKNPPKAVEITFNAVCIIMGKKVKTWKDIQRILTHKLKCEILKFDTKRITSKIRKKVNNYIKNYIKNHPYLTNLSDDYFTYENINRASKIAGPLTLWVKAQIKFSYLLDNCEPMTKEIKEFKEKLATKQKELTRYKSLLSQYQNFAIKSNNN